MRRELASIAEAAHPVDDSGARRSAVAAVAGEEEEDDDGAVGGGGGRGRAAGAPLQGLTLAAAAQETGRVAQVAPVVTAAAVAADLVRE